jgi:hypothetical protein
MSDEKNEMLLLMKELVDKVKSLEQTVYNKENLLMKSGFVVYDSPSPTMDSRNVVSGSTIKKSMDWEDIHKLVKDME